MKKFIVWISLVAMTCVNASFVFAKDPCPNAVPAESNALELDENCQPNWDDFAPVKFEFPDTHYAQTNHNDLDEKSSIPSTNELNSNIEFNNKLSPNPKQEVELNSNVKPTTKENSSIKRAEPTTCTYSAYAWDTKNKRSTQFFEVTKSYDQVTEQERDPNAPMCTICREDQVEIELTRLGIESKPIKICHAYAAQVQAALEEIVRSKAFDITALEGYRPGKTRGAIDKDGLRTQWSQHSFGTAIDINASHNAIYSNCPNALTNRSSQVSSCRRGIGGAWRPEKAPRQSIVKDGVVYRAMTKFWKWGGEISGSTKDIMHFSITGY